MKVGPFIFPDGIKRVAKSIAEAAETAVIAYVNEQVTDEPNITDRWLGAVELATSSGRSRGYSRRTGINWRAKTLRASSGSAAEEKRHGADLLGVAEIHVGGKVIRKGFLGQAKRTEPRTTLTPGGWDDLKEQVDLMLGVSAASFVLTYSKYHGIRFVPAITVSSVDRRDLFELNSLSIQQFFELHLGCFIGDNKLSAPHIKTLDDLRRIAPLSDFPVQNILYLIVSVETK